MPDAVWKETPLAKIKKYKTDAHTVLFLLAFGTGCVAVKMYNSP